jgi:hypothetical protein
MLIPTREGVSIDLSEKLIFEHADLPKIFLWRRSKMFDCLSFEHNFILSDIDCVRRITLIVERDL